MAEVGPISRLSLLMATDWSVPGRNLTRMVSGGGVARPTVWLSRVHRHLRALSQPETVGEHGKMAVPTTLRG